MYADTITIFNRYKESGDVSWYPTVIRNVDLNIDKAAIVAKYGEQSTDNARLHVKYESEQENALISGKRYLPPKSWAAQDTTELPDTITFASGNDFDFFIVGEWAEPDPILDDEFLDGFYNYMNSRYDYVFSVTSVAMYSVIPHFEIMAK